MFNFAQVSPFIHLHGKVYCVFVHLQNSAHGCFGRISPPGQVNNGHVLTKLKFAVRQLSDLPVYTKRKASFLRSDTEFQQLHQELCSDTVYHKRIKNQSCSFIIVFPRLKDHGNSMCLMFGF